MTRCDVVEEVFGDVVDAMHMIVVKDRVRVLSFKFGDAIDHIWLVLEDVGDEDVFAEVIRQAQTPVNLDLEENLLVEELCRVFDEQIIVRLSLTVQIARPVAALKLAALTRRHVGGSRENLELLISLQSVPQVLKLKVTLADKDGLRWVPEGVLLLVREVRHLHSVSVVVKLLAHEVDTVGELIGVPHVEVAIFTVVDLDLEDSFLGFQVSEVRHSARQLRVEADIALEFSCNHVSFTHEGQDLLKLGFEG